MKSRWFNKYPHQPPPLPNPPKKEKKKRKEPCLQKNRNIRLTRIQFFFWFSLTWNIYLCNTNLYHILSFLSSNLGSNLDKLKWIKLLRPTKEYLKCRCDIVWKLHHFSTHYRATKGGIYFDTFSTHNWDLIHVFMVFLK